MTVRCVFAAFAAIAWVIVATALEGGRRISVWQVGFVARVAPEFVAGGEPVFVWLTRFLGLRRNRTAEGLAVS